MPYVPQQVPGFLQDFDALRKWVEEEFQRLGRAYADDELLNGGNLTSVQTDIATNTAAIAKLTNNQFGRVYLSAAQTGLVIANYVKINFNTVDFDPSGIWDNTNKQFKPTVAGYYTFSWCAQLQCTGGTFVYLADLFKNGVRAARGASSIIPGGPLVSIVTGSSIHHMNGSTDVMEIRAYIEGTASRDIIGGIDITAFMINLVKAD